MSTEFEGEQTREEGQAGEEQAEDGGMGDEVDELDELDSDDENVEAEDEDGSVYQPSPTASPRVIYFSDDDNDHTINDNRCTLIAIATSSDDEMDGIQSVHDFPSPKDSAPDLI
ncbi:hypothetical protein BU17DRAFT_60106 [Hysterangium stoloniferum]|nr:hypothetical protein BU17DRAFT_60106 [Hysterangium stoloniferum]